MSQISLLELPLDVLVNILGNLSYSDLRNVMLTCSTLKDLIINDNLIWRAASQGKLTVHSNCNNSQTDNLSWYHRCRISLNWCKGIYWSKIVIYHQINYMPWLNFHNSKALFVSVGSELRCYPTDKKGFPQCKEALWKLQVPIVKRNDVRTNDISRFVVKNGFIVCGNRDGCTAVYEMENIRHRPQLLCHIRDCHENGLVEVTAVELINSNHKPYVITASGSVSKLCFWCLMPDSNSQEFNSSDVICSSVINLDERIGIRCLDVHSMEDRLCIGPNGNSKPLVLDIPTGQLVYKSEATQNIKQAVRDVRWHNENVVAYVTHSGVLQLLDERTGTVVYDVMDPFQSTLYCVNSDGGNAILVGSSEYSRCVLFDTRNSVRHVQCKIILDPVLTAREAQKSTVEQAYPESAYNLFLNKPKL